MSASASSATPLPIARAGEFLELEKSEIIQRVKLETSIMPEGLLSSLTREEVLDLLADVHVRGDRNNGAFEGGDCEDKKTTR